MLINKLRMFSFFKRFKTRKISPDQQQKTLLKSIDYDPKIILAWAKAIEGNEEITNWLKENGYEELFMATFAIYLKPEARDWLTQNGYAHLMAFINAAEGIESAQKWLKIHQFDLLYHMALAVENDTDSLLWLRTNATQDILFLTKTIKEVKDKIEENHNDIHSFRKDL
jgi:ribosomal protein S15P/S13E